MSSRVVTLVLLAPLLVFLATVVMPLLFPIVLIAVIAISFLEYFSSPAAPAASPERNLVPLLEPLLSEAIDNSPPDAMDLLDMLLPDAMIKDGIPITCALPPLIAQAFIALSRVSADQRYGIPDDPNSPWALFVQVVYEHMRDVWNEHCWNLQARDLQPMALRLYLSLTANDISYDDVPTSVYRDVLSTSYLSPNYDVWDLAGVPHPYNGVTALTALADIRERSRNRAFRYPATSAPNLDAGATADTSLSPISTPLPTPSVIAESANPPSPVMEGFDVPEVMVNPTSAPASNVFRFYPTEAELSLREQQVRLRELEVQRKEQRVREQELKVQEMEQDVRKLEFKVLQREKELKEVQRHLTTDRNNLRLQVKRRTEQHVRVALADVEHQLRWGGPMRNPSVGYLSVFVRDRITAMAERTIEREVKRQLSGLSNALYALADVMKATETQRELLQRRQWVVNIWFQHLADRERELDERERVAGLDEVDR